MPAPVEAATLHIGEVADRVGLSLRTVRYYEEQGLIRPAGRTEGGFRLYTEQEIDRLMLIKQMKPLGFTVQQMAELLAAHDALNGKEAAVRRAAQARITGFAQQALTRCEALRDQLARAEEFARQLTAHSTGRGP